MLCGTQCPPPLSHRGQGAPGGFLCVCSPPAWEHLLPSPLLPIWEPRSPSCSPPAAAQHHLAPVSLSATTANGALSSPGLGIYPVPQTIGIERASHSFLGHQEGIEFISGACLRAIRSVLMVGSTTLMLRPLSGSPAPSSRGLQSVWEELLSGQR